MGIGNRESGIGNRELVELASWQYPALGTRKVAPG